MQKIKQTLTFFIGWPLSVIALIFIGRIFFLQKNTLLSLTHISWYFLVLAFLFFLCYFFLRAYFWQKLLAKKGIVYSFKQTMLTWSLAELKRYIPGNIWSFFARTTAYTQRNHDAKIIVKALVEEIAFLILSSLLVSLLSLNFLVFGFVTLPFAHMLVPVIATIVIGVAVAFSWKKDFHLFIIMSCSFFCFGLGTFFSIESLWYLYPLHILPLSGFFVFSYLVGYLSFITPMGLGVREAVTTAGLAKYTTLSLAALGSIFSRVVLIVAELLFVGLALLWEKIYNHTEKLETHILHYRYEVATGIGILCYSIYFTIASFLRYDNFFTGRFDLGNMDQTVWNTIHGRFFQFTNPDGTNIISRLAYHADYMLALLSPFYYIWQSPQMLLLIQTLALALGAVFVFLIAKQVTQNRFVAFVFAMLYLINPSVNNVNLYDFHAVALATTLLLGSWYFSLKKRYWICMFFLLLAGTTKEELWLTVGLMGLYFLFAKKQIIVGILTALIGFATFYFLLWHAIPTARGGNQFALSYYSDFGTSQTAVVRTILLSPFKVIKTVFTDGDLRFLLAIFAPLGFLALLSPLTLFFAGGDFAIDLLSSNTQLHSIYYQYTASLTPFIFIASIYSFAFLTKKLPQKMVAIALFSIGILCAYLYGPLPGARGFNHDIFTNQLSYAKDIDTFLASIPKKYSVAASNNVGSHLSHRQFIYTIPNGINQADIIVLLLNDNYAQPSLSAQKVLAAKLAQDPLYAQLFQEQDFVVFKKKSVPTYTKKVSHALFPLFKGD